MFDHLLLSPFPISYTVWLLHGERDIGETSSANHEKQHMEAHEYPLRDMINDAFHFSEQPADQKQSIFQHELTSEGKKDMSDLHTGPSDKIKEFCELIRDGEQELYGGSLKYSKLSFLLRLYHIKCLCVMTGKVMTMIIELLQDAFEHAKIPRSFYEAKKTIKKFGLGYIKTHACPNDCMLYLGSDRHRQECKRCGTSRWKPMAKKSSNEPHVDKKKQPKPANWKVEIEYFFA